MPLPYRKIDGCLFTHEHYDHVGGIDDLRPFSRFGTVNLYMEAHLEEVIRLRMPYCFSPHGYKGVPDIRVQLIEPGKVFRVDEVEVTPIRVMHYKLPILGFRIGDFAYLTDVKTIPEGEIREITRVGRVGDKCLAQNGALLAPNLGEALSVIRVINPGTAYLTHISHRLGLHAESATGAARNGFLAYDGLEVVRSVLLLFFNHARCSFSRLLRLSRKRRKSVLVKCWCIPEMSRDIWRQVFTFI